jgi:conjugal transfer mating pair stabilization protein TraG
MYWIYTIGDAAFLHNIFTSISAIMGGAHENEYIVAVKICLLIGVILYVAKGITGQINWGAMILGLILYSALFLPKVDVSIEDVYTHDVYVVNDIPFGIAAAGHISSKIGVTLTQWFDQGFSMPNAGDGLTTDGYLSSLDIMTSTRKFVYNRLNYSTANRIGDSDIAGSWANYIQDCTLIAIDLELLDPEDIYTSIDPYDGLRFNSTTFTTEYTTGGAVNTDTCLDAHAALKAYTSANFIPALADDLRYMVLDPATASAATSADSIAAIDDALLGLGLAGINVQHYMMANVLEPIFNEAVQGKYQNDLQFSSAIMISQALQQRNIQWAAEQSIFNTTLRPLYTFIEGMIYGITPMMALLIALGPMGAGLVMKHMMGLLWIQLWMPLLAIANLFIHLSATSRMSNLGTIVDMPIPSMGSIILSDDTLSTWLAVGGYMAASAPVLAAFLVTGSAVALSGLASKMTGQDTINEKMVSPDLTSPKPVLGTSSPYGHSLAGGLVRDDAKEYGPSLSYAMGGGIQASSLESYAKSKSISYDDNVSKAVSSSLSNANSRNLGVGLSQNHGAGQSKTREAFSAAALQYADAVGHDVGNVQNYTDAFTAAITGGGNVGASLTKFQNKVGKGDVVGSKLRSDSDGDDLNIQGKSGHAGVQGGVSMQKSMREDTGTSVSVRAGHSYSSLNDFLDKTGQRSAIETAMRADIKDGKNQSWEKSAGVSDNQQLATSKKESEQAEKRFQKAKTYNSTSGLTQSVSAAAWSEIASQSGVAGQMANIAKTNAGTAGSYHDNYKKLKGMFGEGKAEAVSAIMAAADYANSENGSFEPFDKMQNMLKGVLPGAFSSSISQPTNADLASDAKNMTGTKERVQNKTGGVAPNLNAAGQQLENVEPMVEGNVGSSDAYQNEYKNLGPAIENRHKNNEQVTSKFERSERQKGVAGNMGQIEGAMQLQAANSPSLFREASTNLGGDYAQGVGFAMNQMKANTAALGMQATSNIANAGDAAAEMYQMTQSTDAIGPAENVGNMSQAMLSGAGTFFSELSSNPGSPVQAFKSAVQAGTQSYGSHDKSDPTSYGKAIDRVGGAFMAAATEIANTEGFAENRQAMFEQLQSDSQGVIREALSPMQEQYGLSDTKMDAIVSGIQMGAYRDMQEDSTMSQVHALLPDVFQSEGMLQNSDWYQENFNNLKEESRPIYEAKHSDPVRREQALNDMTHDQMSVITNSYKSGEHAAGFMTPVFELQQAQDDFNR